MFIFNFFNSYPGMYVTQAFCHSVIASIISDQALRAWDIGAPGIRQRFRLIVVLIPVFSFPLYQAFNHGRSSISFRLAALFDVNRWMNMEIWGKVPVGVLFLVILAVTSLIFLFQELIPILIHTVQSRRIEQEGVLREPDTFIESCSRTLGIRVPPVFILDDDDLVIFSTTGKNSAVFISNGLVKKLSADELRAALAHELAHIARSRRPVLLAVFVLRIVMFFNPISLVEFRRAVRNEEKICDDVSVSLTNRPAALIGALKKFFPEPEVPQPDAGKQRIFIPIRLEEYSHSMQLENRIARLSPDVKDASGGRWTLFVFTVLIIIGINYFVV